MHTHYDAPKDRGNTASNCRCVTHWLHMSSDTVIIGSIIADVMRSQVSCGLSSTLQSVGSGPARYVSCWSFKF